MEKYNPVSKQKSGWDKVCIHCGKEFDFVRERWMHENYSCSKAKVLKPLMKGQIRQYDKLPMSLNKEK